MDVVKAIDLVYMLITIVVAIGAYLMHSPLGSGLPTKVVKALGYLSRPEIGEILNSARNVVSGPDGRKTEAIRLVKQYTAGKDFELDDKEAEALVEWITDKYKDGAKWLKERKE